ncbi:MAG: anthranilate synthase [Phormidesmis sp.]
MLSAVKSSVYKTSGNIEVSRTTVVLPMQAATEEILSKLDSQVGGLLASSYEYPGRYKRWAIGFVNPPLALTTKDSSFTLRALNERGQLLIHFLAKHLCKHSELKAVTRSQDHIAGLISPAQGWFPEEARSKQPSVFTVVRAIMTAFGSGEDEYLGLYGALGYDLVYQFEPIGRQRDRAADQRDLVLYLPDQILVVDHYQQQAFQLSYDFESETGSTCGLPRDGRRVDYKGDRQPVHKAADYPPAGYAGLVDQAFDYFRRGDLFEVVPSQNFYERCEASPADLFRRLLAINPSPYGFIFNLGGEYLIGASPEMFVRVDGRRVETCPISGTITRGKNAIEDAMQIRLLLNSLKDESELTMCTDVDRNDKSRICEPGSVRVIGRRQVELYSHLIHTVDHVEGILCPEFDGLDAFLSHMWAVTVTGAPKRAAIAFLEAHERSPRRWYGGAVGGFMFNGNVHTGLTLRAIRLQDSVAEVRVGATVLYDSDPASEEQETLVKAAAMMQTLREASVISQPALSPLVPEPAISSPAVPVKIVLIDHEDSFVHTLANYLRQTGANVTTWRHGFPQHRLETERPDLVVLSPGPGSPSDFNLAQTIMACVRCNIPMFGVCLGLQGIVEAFGGKLGVLSVPQHGKASLISVVADSVLFENLPRHFEAGRYHSLHALPQQMPSELTITARSADDVVMAIEHKTLPIAAVQFHPESIMTLANNTGLTIIHNVVNAYVRSPKTVLARR